MLITSSRKTEGLFDFTNNYNLLNHTIFGCNSEQSEFNRAIMKSDEGNHSLASGPNCTLIKSQDPEEGPGKGPYINLNQGERILPQTTRPFFEGGVSVESWRCMGKMT